MLSGARKANNKNHFRKTSESSFCSAVVKLLLSLFTGGKHNEGQCRGDKFPAERLCLVDRYSGMTVITPGGGQ